MRLGGPIFKEWNDPDSWAEAIKACGYQATFCPDVSLDEINGYVKAAADADIVIAEVGAWSNPLSPDDKTRKEALDKCKQKLALADAAGARCCVNIAGSLGEKWDGPCAKDLTEEAFEKIVEMVREIIDDVKPTRSYYTLEPMPWMYPDSPDSYLRLIEAIDRKQFAAHFDPVNIINNPQRYSHNADFLKECIAKLGPYIKSCHAKDIKLDNKLTVHLDEVRPGTGNLDYRVYISELNKLDPDLPLMIEHLPDEAEYLAAAEYIRSVEQEL